MKKYIRKMFHPPKLIAFLFCLCSTILLIYVFSFHLEGYFISYMAYILSFYSLILFMIWFCKACKFSSSVMKNTEIYQYYKTHFHAILKIKLIITSIIHFIYAFFKLITGIYYMSVWFITFAVYYLVLCFMKINILKDIKHFGENISKEYIKLKHTAIILFLLNMVLVGMIVLIITKDISFYYPGYLIYVIAIYNFYLIISAIIDIFKYKDITSPCVVASKAINLMVAMISILSLEVAMIYQFGDHDSHFKLVMISSTGVVIAIINSVLSIYMIVKANKQVIP